MRKILLLLCSLNFVFLSAQEIGGQPATINYKGYDYFINGLNVPWHHFGGDFGNHIKWGAMYDTAWFDYFFEECSNNGVNVVRLWIHCDGRASPEFDSSGYVVGLDTDFFIDLDDCFRRAQKHGVMIMPCIWSFDMCKVFEDAGPTAGGHHGLLIEDDKMMSYIEKAWIPMVKRYADQCNLFAWEVCNEPEWALDRSRYNDTLWNYRTDSVVPIERMQKLTGLMAAVVHEYSDKMVTTGSASIRWNSDVAPAVENLWDDESLMKATNGNEKAYLDFYQVHYYDYMVPLGADLYDTLRDVEYYKLDKPVMIGETPSDTSKAKIHTVEDVMELSIKNGYAGIMYWSFNAKDGIGTWTDFKHVNKSFAERYPSYLGPETFVCRHLDISEFEIKFKSGWLWDKLIFKPKSSELTKKYILQKKLSSGKYKTIKSYINNAEEAGIIKIRKKIKDKNADLRLVREDVYGYKTFSEPFKTENK